MRVLLEIFSRIKAICLIIGNNVLGLFKKLVKIFKIMVI